MDRPEENPAKGEEQTAELQDAASRAADDARQQMSEISDDFESRMDSLTARGKEAKERYEAKKTKAAAEQKSSGEAAKGLGVGLTIAYGILGTPLVGFGIGYLIDMAVGGKVWQSWLTILGAFAGMVFAVVTLQRQEQ